MTAVVSAGGMVVRFRPVHPEVPTGLRGAGPFRTSGAEIRPLVNEAVNGLAGTRALIGNPPSSYSDSASAARSASTGSSNVNLRVLAVPTGRHDRIFVDIAGRLKGTVPSIDEHFFKHKTGGSVPFAWTVP